MGQINDTRVFSGGMDQDAPDETISENDYRSLLNARNKFGKVVNLKGNTNINDFSAPSGNSHNPSLTTFHSVIGSTIDLENKAIIYFVKARTQALSAIYRVYNENSFIEVIHIGSVLDFTLAYPVYDAKIINDYLFWTDNNNPPRMLNIKKAADLNGLLYGAGEYYINGEIVQNSDSVWKCISATEISGVTPVEGVNWTELRTVDAYDSIDSQTLDIIKHAPTQEMELTYFTDSNFQTNYLKGKVFQFAYRYVYDDNSKSTLSPYSKVEIPVDEYFTNGESNLDSLNNNGLRLIFNVGHLLVQKVEIFVREGNSGDWFLYDTVEKYDSSGDYIAMGTLNLTTDGTTTVIMTDADEYNDIVKVGMFLNGAYVPIGVQVTAVSPSVQEITVDPTTTGSGTNDINIIPYPDGWVTYTFYNNKSFIAQDQDDLVRPFDYVPKLAQNLEVIEETRLTLANYTQGFDNVDVDVTLIRTEDENIAIPSFGSLTDATKVTITYSSGDSSATSLAYNFAKPGSVSADSYLTFIVKLHKTNDQGVVTLNRTYSFRILLNSDDVVSLTTVSTKIREVINKNDRIFTPYPYAGTLPDVYGTDILGSFTNVERIYIMKDIYDIGSTSSFVTIDQNDVTIEVYIDDYTYSYKTWKDGDVFFGIEYTDEPGRFGNVNTSDDCLVSIPTMPQRAVAGEAGSNPYRYTRIKWEVNHVPPIWAYYWRWVVYDSVSFYLQFKFRTYRIEGGKVRIWFNEFIQVYNENNGTSKISEYIYQEGDRFRILAVKVEDFGWSTPNAILEGEIVGGENNDDGNYEIIVENITEIVDYSAIDYFLGEVYTPSKTISEKVYREIGETYLIGNPGGADNARIHLVDTTIDTAEFTNQVNGGDPAKGYFLSGNAYVSYRNDMHEAFPCIRQEMTDFYSSEAYDFGIRNVTDSNAAEQEFITRVSYGGKFINDTALNFVSKFEFDAYVELSEKYGPINRIIDNGETLKVLQRNKENSIYVGRTEMAQPSGSSVLIRSDDVLGTINVLEDDYGCQHSRGVVKHNRHIYYPDLDEGVVIRTSPNGPFPISSYGFESWFKDKFNSMKISTDTTYVFATFVDERNEYILCLVDGDTVVCLVFNEDTNRWTHKLTMLKENGSTKIEHLESTGQTLYSFLQGDAWRHEDNSTYGYLFGEQRKQEIQFIGNKAWKENKVFKNITIHTDNNKYDRSDDTTNWSIPTITIPSSGMYPSGMSSRLKAKKFEGKEGNLHSEFLGDLNTPNKSGKDALLNGRELRGKIIDITMENEKTTEVNLISVTIDSDLSELNES